MGAMNQQHQRPLGTDSMIDPRVGLCIEKKDPGLVCGPGKMGEALLRTHREHHQEASEEVTANKT